MLRLLDNPMLVSRNSRALSAAILRPAFAVASRVKEVYVLCIGMQRLFELHDGDGDGVILHEEFLNALYAIRKLSSGGPEDQVKCALSDPSWLYPTSSAHGSCVHAHWHCLTSNTASPCCTAKGNSK